MAKQKAWSQEEENLLKELYPNDLDCYAKFQQRFPQRTIVAIHSRASELGFKRCKVPTGHFNNLKVGEIEQPAKLELTETEAAYLAGIVDGEGSIYGYWRKNLKARRNKQAITTVRVYNSSSDLMEWLNKIYPGTRPGGFGSFPGSKKRVFIWEILGKRKVLPLLEAIEPYLIIKKRHAQLAIRFMKSRLNRPYHVSTYTDEEIQTFEELRTINRR